MAGLPCKTTGRDRARKSALWTPLNGILLNTYPNKPIGQQFQSLLDKYGKTLEATTASRYIQPLGKMSTIILQPENRSLNMDYASTLLVHFTNCVSMRRFPRQSHSL